jgi:hypothetical protein
MAIKIWGAGSTAGSDTDWNTPTNWDNDTLPIDGDSLLFNGTASTFLAIGPTSSIYIENITIDANAIPNECFITGYEYNNSNFTWEDKYPLILYGQLINNSPSLAALPAVVFGISQVTGPWELYLVTSTNPITYQNGSTSEAYLAISNPVFDSTNYIQFTGLANVYDLKYGIGSASGIVSSVGAFQTFTNSVNAAGGMNTSALFGIQANILNVNSSAFVSIAPYSISAPSNNLFQIATESLNLTNCEDLLGGLIAGGMSATFRTAIISYSTNATNINLHNSVMGRYSAVVFTVANVNINMTGNSKYYGTSDFNFGVAFSPTFIGSYTIGTAINLTANDSSHVLGIFESGQFKDGALNYSGFSSSVFEGGAGLVPSSNVFYNILMKGNSIFNGVIISSISSVTTSLLFSDNASVSVDYSLYGAGQNRYISYSMITPQLLIKKITKASF